VFVLFALILSFDVGDIFCSSSKCEKVFVFVAQVLMILSFLILLFSTLTYFLREAAFRAWWSFARWWTPIIVLVSLFLLKMPSGGGGYLSMGKDFDTLVLVLLYGTLVIISLWRIARVYWTTK
jgi:hypothetical protein